MKRTTSILSAIATALVIIAHASIALGENLAIRAKTIYTMTDKPIKDGIILIADGKIERVGLAADIEPPEGYRLLEAQVVTPGLIDAHSTVGLTGYLNQRQDQDQIDHSEPIQPELRAIDAYDPQERLIEWVRGFGITTLHTGHAPGEVISGQTMIVKTTGKTVDEAVIIPTAMIAATLGDGALRHGGKSPGTRSKAVALLRAELIKAQAYLAKGERASRPPASQPTESRTESDKPAGDVPEASKHVVTTQPGEPATSQPMSDVPPPGTNGQVKPEAPVNADATAAPETSTTEPNAATPSADDKASAASNAETGHTAPDRDLRMETLVRVLKRELPLLITVHRSADIVTALRLAKEFNIRIVLDGASEAYLVREEIRAAGVPVILHPPMMRSGKGQTENAGMETASILRKAGIPFALQSGFEAYVPKTRIVLFEAGIAASNGLNFHDALASITIDAAKILGISDRVGSIEPGKDADVALFDGDPFEYTTHCTGVVINGKIASEDPR